MNSVDTVRGRPVGLVRDVFTFMLYHKDGHIGDSTELLSWLTANGAERS